MTATLTAILTPLGEGGIGVVGLLGPRAVEIANAVFRGTRVKDLRALPSGRICHGFVHDETGPVDEVIVHLSRGSAPESNLVEINCHGGIVPVRKVLSVCLRRGATEAAPEEFARRACAEREGLDLVQQEAWSLLPNAHTLPAALVLLDQIAGALSDSLRSQVGRLEALDVNEVSKELQDLLARAPFGIALMQPRRLVVVGKPNVGKSTLVNTLLAEERVLVHHLPGTTRDAVAALVEISGVPFELVDTAGLRESGHHLEMLGVEQTWREVAEADILLLLLDSSQPLDADDAHVLAALRARDVIFVVTKTDLPEAFDRSVVEKAARAPLCIISARTGAGIESLCRVILQRVGFAPHEPGRAVPFTARQVEALRAAAEILKEAASGRKRGQAHFAQAAGQNVPVPFSSPADRERIRSAADRLRALLGPQSS
jgi:tRNA modification GTPase